MHTGTRYVSKPHPILLEPSKHGKRHGKTSVHTLGLRMRFQWEAGVKEDCQYMIVQRIGLESLTVRESDHTHKQDSNTANASDCGIVRRVTGITQ